MMVGKMTGFACIIKAVGESSGFPRDVFADRGADHGQGQPEALQPAVMIRRAVPSETVPLHLPDETATERLARQVAALARPGDVIALHGDLGAGKTRFARAFIGQMTGETEVPSPTFTLVQTYEAPDATIWHFDLYRLASPEEAIELGLEEAFSSGVSLVEWPDRLGSALPEDRLDIVIDFAGPTQPDARIVSLRGLGRWAPRARDLEQSLTHDA